VERVKSRHVERPEELETGNERSRLALLDSPGGAF
jgi:hypothetical protein